MKNFSPLLLFVLIFSAVSCTSNRTKNQNSDLDGLKVLEENYPRAFFFRVSERTYEPYEVWESDMNRLTGIMGKTLEEENRGREKQNTEFFTRFKKNQPDQVVLLHYAGNSRLPDYRTDKFHAGHWLYFNGATILSDLSADEDSSIIRVSDARLFEVNMGRHKDEKDDIGLCELDEKGLPVWNSSEQVKLLSVDVKNNTITVRRGCYGTVARAFESGKSYAAAHACEGPWGENSGLMWMYNFSTLCPKDPEGKNCNDRLVEDILEIFLPGGILEVFDGVEFDVLIDDLRNQPAVSRNYLPGSLRMPDSNCDGKPDEGVFDGINEYGEGVMQFLRDLRDGLGDNKFILADGYGPYHVRGMGILNGIESEGWPIGNDPEIRDWSGGMNRHNFWDINAREPKLNFMNHRWWNPGSTIGVERLVIAASCLTNSAHALADRPKAEPGQTQTAIWDELVMGKESKPGWLGKPLGPTRCLSMLETNLLEGLTPVQLISRISCNDPEISITSEGNAVRVEGAEGEWGKKIEITIDDIPCPSEDLTVFLTMHGEPMTGRSPEEARLIRVTTAGRSYARGMMSFLNGNPFQSSFYFNSHHNISPQQTPVTLKIEVEGSDPFWISDIMAYAHPDSRVREFENGIVIANPAPHPCSFDLQKLFENQTFRRLNGSSAQDPVTNNGAMVEGVVELQAKDALFLTRY
jgi:hypothetical protein